MAKNIIITGKHRNKSLAQRRAKQLAKSYGARVQIQRINASGRLSKRGGSYRFIIKPARKSKFTWRATASQPYAVRQGKGKAGKKQSPEHREYIVRAFFKTKKQATEWSENEGIELAQEQARVNLPKLGFIIAEPNYEVARVQLTSDIVWYDADDPDTVEENDKGD